MKPSSNETANQKVSSSKRGVTKFKIRASRIARAHPSPSDRIPAFLHRLGRCSPEHVECMVEFPGEFRLTEILSGIEHLFRFVGDEWALPEPLDSDNFLRLTVGCLLRTDLIDSADVLSLAYRVVSAAHRDSGRRRPKRLALLEELGIDRAVLRLVEREARTSRRVESARGAGTTVSVPHFVSLFFPPLAESKRNRDVDRCCRGLLYNGLCERGGQPETAGRDGILPLLATYFPAVLAACRAPDSSLQYQTVLFKMASWACATGSLDTFARPEELLALASGLIRSLDDCRIVVGFATVHLLLELRPDVLRGAKFYGFLAEFLEDHTARLSFEARPWVEEIYDASVVYWLSPEEMAPVSCSSSSSSSSSSDRLKAGIELVDAIYRIVMENAGRRRRGSADVLSARYANLSQYLSRLLSLSDAFRIAPELTVPEQGRENFETIVAKVVEVIDDLQLDRVFIGYEQDMECAWRERAPPETPGDVDLGLYFSAGLDRVLGESRSPLELTTNPMARALRVLSILYEVNESWGVPFGHLTDERLIDRGRFVCRIFDRYLDNMVAMKIDADSIPGPIVRLAIDYPFLFSFETREELFRLLAELDSNARGGENAFGALFVVSRHRVADTVSSDLDKMTVFPKTVSWAFQFFDEMGTGHGATKEFYDEFSLDCRRLELGLWLSDEAKRHSSGTEYAHSPCGLFPLPAGSHPCARSDSTMAAVGTLIGKSVQEGYRMDLDFSEALYKSAFNGAAESQHLTLQDLKSVMPAVHRFARSLVYAHKLGCQIDKEESLTAEQRAEARSSVTIDGCTFDDLCVNFTVPGRPDIELIEGGRDVYLDLENVVDYLQLLVWKILHDGPRRSLDRIREGFASFIPMSHMKLFYPCEVERLLCGVKMERWTVDYLREHCVTYDGLTVDTPVVRFLFEVLTSLSAGEQSLFLRFVTSSSRLPIGGLKNLEPRLNVRKKSATGDDQDACLPTAMTCYNTLFVSEYSSKEVLKERLLMAIENGCNSFGFV